MPGVFTPAMMAIYSIGAPGRPNQPFLSLQHTLQEVGKWLTGWFCDWDGAGLKGMRRRRMRKWF
jgi:hypothetical protein